MVVDYLGERFRKAHHNVQGNCVCEQMEFESVWAKGELFKFPVSKASALLTLFVSEDIAREIDVFHSNYSTRILITSAEATAASIKASQSSLLSDSKIFSSLGFVVGCFGRNTVQQSS